ncbi:hypothetical protein A3B05_00600 [Candidatus Giovannonibacteria bacterium RIFCSPLOWO2_01_FULL_43_160]|uniref:Phospholipid/glycerol acyltransferase domain-containing protein n=3 Tax=Parcubacteria group TaxID=1794811 RepID=A0A1F5XXA6_9BACT|nr:MAG: hypothetical protein A2652_02940 [Candidatus Giovannonibacteria bacterium RIFCSPHIGHO2_01_FULL_43_140]OGF74922.1 MAG: hypothetical protein A3B05_00600 [Candidatus Giovannonibacteria bacterium RIFCSPLOWO2_01_FULL_43_160]OGF86053.1 MAG: hypothetical protein A3I28_03475 [Candidatus Giovannonibacteria bacterium RIFCSPLOWO2_02_FULL_43_37]OGF92480.1 MAG: hypothetical protein A3H05_02565 [Candidatus Giovannonibacteria bacterium RIFCSPLOWO2_12_FULL_43_26]
MLFGGFFYFYIKHDFFAIIKKKMKYWYWFIQNLMWPAVWVLLRLFYRIEIRGKEHLKNIRPPVIIASNHKTIFDVFLIGTSLPFASHFFPFRFMTEEERFHHPMLEFLRKIKFLKLVYLLTGGFPSKRGQGLGAAVVIPTGLLGKGETIIMFPEGRLVRGEELGVFYNGAAALALESGKPILPFFIKIEDRKIIITIGEIFELKNQNFNEGTSAIRVKIENLRTL